MDDETGSTSRPIAAASRRSRPRAAWLRDPAVWVWLVVGALALFPLGTVLAGFR